MCGRFVCISPAETLMKEFNAENALHEFEPSLELPSQYSLNLMDNAITQPIQS